MPAKSLLLGILASVLAFGVMVSGCNRDNRTAMRTQRGRGGARPAEVLSGQAYRPPVRHYAEPAVHMAYASPAPMAPTAFIGPVYTDPAPSPIPLYVPTSQPVAVYQPPELAMVRATLPPPPPQAVPGRAPIPELEPVRYTRQAARSSRPAEVMVSTTPHYDRTAARRALAPLAQAAPTPAPASGRGWVSSPSTAMRSIY